MRGTIERGDLEIRYYWSDGDAGDRWYPGEAAHAEEVRVYWRGREVRRISTRNLERLENEITACHG